MLRAGRVVVLGIVAVALWSGTATAAGRWAWPVAGPVIRPFVAPASPFGPGHRGIDIGAPSGTPVRAPAPGVVTFAGTVAGSLFLTIDHGGGLRSSYSWLSGLVAHAGDRVSAGTVVAWSGGCHPGDARACLHFGVRAGDAYVDPMIYLGPVDVSDLIRLAPLHLAG